MRRAGQRPYLLVALLASIFFILQVVVPCLRSRRGHLSPFIPQEELHATEPAIECSVDLPECTSNLLAATSSKDCCNCCTNRIVVNHKMGYVFGEQTIKGRFNYSVGFKYIKIDWRNTSDGVPAHQWFMEPEGSPVYDNFREVLITRNWWEAIVSGYLYHKDGRECWKNAFVETRPANAPVKPVGRTGPILLNISRQNFQKITKEACANI